ncbi:MAG: hypothetical protein Q3961_04185, partial [Bifidobacteriaceae bacterium]|nr:hypothetical protein [Bifidobacteriaceae bacterium]
STLVDKISHEVESDDQSNTTTEVIEKTVGENVMNLIEKGDIDLVLNTPSSRGSRSDGYVIRAAATAADLAHFTTVTEFSAVLMGIEAVKKNDYQIMSIQEHAQALFALDK